MLLNKLHFLRRTQSRLVLIRTSNKCCLFSTKQNEMVSIKTAITLQYYFISRYKNLTRKILKCNSKIYFNKQCVFNFYVRHPRCVTIKMDNIVYDR
jgi:hypothetical protein